MTTTLCGLCGGASDLPPEIGSFCLSLVDRGVLASLGEASLCGSMVTDSILERYRNVLTSSVADLGLVLERLEASVGAVIVKHVSAVGGEFHRNLSSALISIFGVPFKPMDASESLWNEISVRLDGDPARSGGLGRHDLHIDIPNASNPPDLTVLFCDRPDPLGGGHTLLAPVERVLGALSPASLDVLREEVFRESAGSFFGLSGVGTELRQFSVVPKFSDGFVRYSRHVSAVDPVSPGDVQRALDEFEAAGSAYAIAVPLEPGDLCVIDQRRLLHGKTPLGAGQQGLSEGSRRSIWQAKVSTTARPDDSRGDT